MTQKTKVEAIKKVDLGLSANQNSRLRSLFTHAVGVELENKEGEIVVIKGHSAKLLLDGTALLPCYLVEQSGACGEIDVNVINDHFSIVEREPALFSNEVCMGKLEKSPMFGSPEYWANEELKEAVESASFNMDSDVYYQTLAKK